MSKDWMFGVMGRHCRPFVAGKPAITGVTPR